MYAALAAKDGHVKEVMKHAKERIPHEKETMKYLDETLKGSEHPHAKEVLKHAEEAMVHAEETLFPRKRSKPTNPTDVKHRGVCLYVDSSLPRTWREQYEPAAIVMGKLHAWR